MDFQRVDRGGVGQLNSERVNAVASFGLTDRQARFLVAVMLHSGVFVGRQYCAFAGITHGQKVHDFVEKLLARRLATATMVGAQQRARVFHVFHKPLYAAIGEPDNRHRKPPPIVRAIERLMILDGVLADPTLTWLGTEREKQRHFLRQLGTRLEMHEYPRLVFGTPPNMTVRYFHDKLPIGVDPDNRRHVFLYLPTSSVPMDFRLFLLRHAELFHALGDWTIRVLFSRPIWQSPSMFMSAAYDQLARPLRTSEVEELRWLFWQRRSATSDGPAVDPARLAATSKAFRGPRFQALYRRWLDAGDSVLWLAQSTAFRDALERSEARIECLELPHSYMNLSQMIGTA
ncbi:MAG: hypothetical protein AAB403_01860 [Planctomycetota bacterium]